MAPIPLAHVGHWLWALYLPPILIVAGSIARTRLRERRGPDSQEGPDNPDPGPGDAASKS